jgi:hypothetical protein
LIIDAEPDTLANDRRESALPIFRKSIIDALEPHCAFARTLKLLPNVRKFTMESSPPQRDLRRMERADPKVSISAIENLQPR